MDQKPPFSNKEESDISQKHPAPHRVPRRTPDDLFGANTTPSVSPAKELQKNEESRAPAGENTAIGASPEDLITKTIPVPPGVAPDVFAEEKLPEKPAVSKKNDASVPTVAGNVFDWVKTFIFSLAAVILVFNFFLRGVTVDGTSMLPTLENGEYLIISDLFYTPKTGDIVVVQSPIYKDGTEPLVKRVIAVGGQTVKINFATWRITVDGEELHEDYILRDGFSVMNPEDVVVNADKEAEITVRDGCVFVMGDNRNDSLDSRSSLVGQIDEHYVMGRVLWRVSPFSRFGKVS